MTGRFLIAKLFVLAVLILVAIILGQTVLTLQLQVNRERIQRGVTATVTPKSISEATTTNEPSTPSSSTWIGAASKHTIKPSYPTGAYDIRLWNLFPAPEGGNYKTIGEAYWRQVQAVLRDNKDPSDHQTRVTDWMVRSPDGSVDPRFALERAAGAGHPTAQHYLANAYSSGIWPVPAVNGQTFANENLTVSDDWLPTEGDLGRQIDKAYLLWHMAALGGNIESAMALAFRLDSNGCEESLPYYQAAADGIMDQLEVSKHSRAKVIPPMDKHTLAQVHIHGGTSSQLDWNNKPDESKEALQYYHMKATTTAWYKTKSKTSTQDDAKKKRKKQYAEEEGGIDVYAAFTLAHMYHHGSRGVEQNLTKSLEYYEIAGTHGNWESAGQACIFHLWGIGTEQNANLAMDFCKLGAPKGFDGCLRIFHETDGKERDRYNPVNCNKEALNGLGLLHLLGIRGVLEIDTSLAEKYFTLAKELGSMDAYYNLAMMYLGWKTHYKTVDELKETGTSAAGVQSAEDALPIPGETTTKKDSSEKFVLYKASIGDSTYYKGPIQTDVMNAIQLLEVASKLGHVQAKHRLGMIYAQGLTHTTSVIQYNFVKRSCAKAKESFQWIITNASPTRSDRLRTAYKEYIAGNLEVSLRNYIAAAEVGSIVGQVNAAFLMERGMCLDLDEADCAKASVRLWKAAAERGNVEACLRVGDFYYYGRLHGEKLHIGPFGWIQYFLHPEKYLPTLFQEWSRTLGHYVLKYTRTDNERINSESSTASTCEANEEGTCRVNEKTQPEDTTATNNSVEREMEGDLHTAAHYYQIAGEKHHSARANFNLGFMHQWGLGLKQDFPMAKRHYDLALSKNNREAELAVQIALIAMNIHEFIIRCKVILEDWWFQRDAATAGKGTSPSSSATKSKFPPPDSVPHATKTMSGTQPKSPQQKTREEVILSHVFDRSSLVIVILVFLLLVIQIIMFFIARPLQQHQ